MWRRVEVNTTTSRQKPQQADNGRQKVTHEAFTKTSFRRETVTVPVTATARLVRRANAAEYGKSRPRSGGVFTR